VVVLLLRLPLPKPLLRLQKVSQFIVEAVVF
jgi:hypothetical protein